MGAQVIAAQQGKALVRSPGDTDVDVGGASAGWLAEQLLPVTRRTRRAGWSVIGRVTTREHEAGLPKRLSQLLRVQRGHGYLDVENVLGRQTRHRRRANVVDAEC